MSNSIQIESRISDKVEEVKETTAQNLDTRDGLVTIITPERKQSRTNIEQVS